MRNSTKLDGRPGTGKTTMCQTMAMNWCNDGYRSSDITFMTFRKSTAEELKTLLPGSEAGTLHSICRKLSGDFGVIDDADLQRFAVTHGYDTRNQAKSDGSGGNVFDCYSWMRNTLSSPDDVYDYPGYDGMDSIDFEKFVGEYEDYKKTLNKIDYCDMLRHVVDYKLTLDALIGVGDEYQDNTPLQDLAFKQLTSECEEVLRAGDPGQSIYAVFGAMPEVFDAWKGDNEITLPVSHRLYAPIWELARETLAAEGQETPTISARYAPFDPIEYINFNDVFPKYPGSELHLVRCNHQAPAIAYELADQGKLFSGLSGWTSKEKNLFNLILRMREHCVIYREDLKLLCEYFPKYVTATNEEIDKYTPADEAPLKDSIYQVMRSPNPIAFSDNDSRLINLKIKEVLKWKTTPITNDDLRECRILTIHGSKGTEADTVYLHTGITNRIRKAVLDFGAEAEAEARVWYVGITRARERLVIVHDKGRNYALPGMVA